MIGPSSSHPGRSSPAAQQEPPASCADNPDAAFPVTVTVTMDFTDHDPVLALGVVPVGLVNWYGDYPFGTWPWAQDALGRFERAAGLIAAVEERFAQAHQEHPDSEGATAILADRDAELSRIRRLEELRVQVLTELGFTYPDKIEELFSGESSPWMGWSRSSPPRTEVTS